MKDVTYASGKTPPDYKCGKCGATNCKLWREYQTAMPELTCASCTEAADDKDRKIDSDLCDQLGWRVAAVPTEDGIGYWGYCAVPEPGCAWWYALPTRPEVSP